MANIQQSVNSVLTTSAALKALGEKRELKKEKGCYTVSVNNEQLSFQIRLNPDGYKVLLPVKIIKSYPMTYEDNSYIKLEDIL